MDVSLVIERAEECLFIKRRFFEDHAAQVVACAREMAVRFAAGRKLLTLGNGGSCTDALHCAVEFTDPVIRDRPAFPALALSADATQITAFSNDFSFADVFARQIQLLGQPGDMLMALSTSGSSPNVLNGLRAARERGMLTISLSGKGGGEAARLADYSFVVPSQEVPRIQEAHVMLYHILWDLVHLHLQYDAAIPDIGARPAPPAAAVTPPSAVTPAPAASPPAAPGPAADRPGVQPALKALYPYLYRDQ